MSALLIGYARCLPTRKTSPSNTTPERTGRAVEVYVDHGLTGSTETGPVCGKPWRPVEQGTPSS